MKRSLLPKNIKSTFRARSVIISNALTIHYIKESWLRILRHSEEDDVACKFVESA